jgi:hypothetical protein
MDIPHIPKKIKGSIFKFIASLFKKHKVRGVMVGGYALVANKVQRMTFDIDFMITSADLERIEADILSAGYSFFNRQNAFVQFKSSIPGLRDLDFLLGDQHTIDVIIGQGKEITIVGETFIVPSPLHLIEMKLHSLACNKMREIKDLPDIAQLLQANAIDPTDARIKKMFEKYKLLEIYKRRIISIGDGNGQ